ncbi:MAG: hypothetical protein IPH10_14295 [bacterium]|nr:hypothetical protein [bacterium]
MRKALLIVMLASACAAQATVRYVPDDFPDLQAALDTASSGDTVICRPGTYNGSFVIPPIHITLGSEYVFTADTALISTTVIQPGAEDPERRCLTADSAASRDTSLTIVGLTVTLGRATADNVTEKRAVAYSFNAATSNCGIAFSAQTADFTAARSTPRTAPKG